MLEKPIGPFQTSLLCSFRRSEITFVYFLSHYSSCWFILDKTARSWISWRLAIIENERVLHRLVGSWVATRSGGIQPVCTGSIELSHRILWNQRTGWKNINKYDILSQNRWKISHARFCFINVPHIESSARRIASVGWASCHVFQQCCLSSSIARDPMKTSSFAKKPLTYLKAAHETGIS